MLLSSLNCKREAFDVISEVTTDSVSTFGIPYSVGSIVDFGSAESILDHGHCWSMDPDPRLGNSESSHHGTVSEGGSFSSEMKDLLPDTVYYVRSWVKDSYGVRYARALAFPSSYFAAESLPGEVFPDTNTFLMRGRVHTNDSNFIAEKGICWSFQSPYPTLSSEKVFSTLPNDTMNTLQTNLPPGKRAWYRAFVIGSNGVVKYGDIKMIQNGFVVKTGSIVWGTRLGASPPSIAGRIENCSFRFSEFGHCWTDENRMPTIEDGHYSHGRTEGGKGYHTSLLRLKSKRNYVIRAYARTVGGEVFYGNEVTVNLDQGWVFRAVLDFYPIRWYNPPVYHNKLILVEGSSPARVYAYDPMNNSVSTISTSLPFTNPIPLFVYGDELFIFSKPNYGYPGSLGKLDLKTGIWTSEPTIFPPNNPFQDAISAPDEGFIWLTDRVYRFQKEARSWTLLNIYDSPQENGVILNWHGNILKCHKNTIHLFDRSNGEWELFRRLDSEWNYVNGCSLGDVGFLIESPPTSPPLHWDHSLKVHKIDLYESSVLSLGTLPNIFSGQQSPIPNIVFKYGDKFNIIMKNSNGRKYLYTYWGG